MFELGKAGCFDEMEETNFDEILKSHDDDNSTQELEQNIKMCYLVLYREDEGECR